MRRISHRDQIFPIEATALGLYKIKELLNHNKKNSCKILWIYFVDLLLKNNFIVV